MKYLSILLTLSLIFSSEWVDLGSSYPQKYEKRVLFSNSNNIRIEFKMSGYYQTLVETPKGSAYIIDAEHGASLLNHGAPDLDKITAPIIIPNQANMNYQIISTDYVEIENINIAPSKGNLTRDIDPNTVPYFYGDKYDYNQFYPNELIEFSNPYILRDLRGQTLIVHPFQYNPATQTLRVYTNITIDIYEDGYNNYNAISINNEELQKVNKEYQNIYKNHFINYTMNNSRFEYLADQGRMLIIAYDDFADEMQPFIEWKNKKGIPTEIINISEIGSNADSIKSFIEAYYEEYEDFVYLLLVGDVNQIPTPIINGASSDPSYGYIEGNDSYSEIIVGRFSANNPSQVITQVNRTLEYEKEPVGNYFTNALGIASNQGPGYGGYTDDEFNEFIWNDILSEFTYDNYQGIYDGGGSVAQAIDAINNGVGIINYTGHAGPTGWGNGAPLGVNDVNNLTNNTKYPFIFTVGCNPGEFNNYTECFCESWMWATDENGPAGAIGHLGSTISQSWEPPMHGQYAMNTILTEAYENNITRSYGGITTNGCMHMNDAQGTSGINETNHWTLFGDPSLSIRTDNPLNITANHNNTIVMGSAEFNISTNTNDGLAALSQNGELLISGHIQNGSIQLDISELNLIPGDYDLVITSFNTYPYESSVSVISPEGAYLVYESVEIISGALMYGETSELSLFVENVGVDAIGNIEAIISTDNPYVVLNDNIVSFNYINSGEISQSNDTFSFSLLNSVPNGHILNFNISMGDWESSFSLQSIAPLFIAENPVLIDDNEDGIWDAGESAIINVDLVNYGNAPFYNYPGAHLTIDSPYAFETIADNNIFYGIEAQTTYQGQFFIESTPDTPDGTNIDFTIDWGYGFGCETDDCVEQFNLPFSATIGLATNEDADVPENLTVIQNNEGILIEWEEPTQCPPDQFADCDDQCIESFYESWLGDGICDDGGWGVNFMCEEFNFDGGDCDDNDDGTESYCGDGICDELNDEDEFTCPEDCYIIPEENSCNGYCGGSAGMCYCDELCADYGDCCVDFCDYCADTNSNYCGESLTYLDNLELNMVYNRTHDQDGNRFPLPENNIVNREEPIGYNLFKNNQLIVFTEDTWYLDTNISSATTYCYDLTAIYQNYQSIHTEQVCIETEGEPISPGDLNIDGSLDILDIVLLVNMILGIEESNYDIGDIDQDGQLTVLDVILIINTILNNNN